MSTLHIDQQLAELSKCLSGELLYSELMSVVYATDASPYRELPLAVSRPKNTADIIALVRFAKEHSITLIPRAGGTSLAGQCVGTGLVVDVSKYMTEILEFNKEERWVRVQPGVVAEQLNDFLRPHGLFFAPNTSTANRCTIGGMVGNNSAGSTSIRYGCTRDHVLRIGAILSDGSEVEFGSLSPAEFAEKTKLQTLEGDLYRSVSAILRDPAIQEEIARQYPKPEITRRNTGYALDELLKANVFSAESQVTSGEDFNFCKLLCGSEGTLAMFRDITLSLSPLPPANKVLVCAHFDSLEDALAATVIALQHAPYSVELMDAMTLDCTKGNLLYQQYRFFIDGAPEGLLVVEFTDEQAEKLTGYAEALIESLKKAGLGYSYPLVWGSDIEKVWALRKAGLGLMSNLPGDAKPVTVVEDTAILPADLPAYIADFAKLLERHGLSSVYYGHAGAGEIHLRPVLNLKDPAHVVLFRRVAEECAGLVKRYRGSLSGEHGDGRLRGEFLPLMFGERLYRSFCELKRVWDPHNIFNRAKIVDAPPMDAALRYEPNRPPFTFQTFAFKTLLNFGDGVTALSVAEQCTGSGDCRKLKGTMCPSYMATRDERDSTRARANVLREYLTRSTKQNPFDQEEIKDVLELCLSCKGCKSECPSNVDMSALKAEFQYQYAKSHGGHKLRSLFFAHAGQAFKLAAHAPRLYNLFANNRFVSGLLKRMLGIAPQRSLPALSTTTLRDWFDKHREALYSQATSDRLVYRRVIFFADEFIDYLEPEIGIKAIKLLAALGYQVEMPVHEESARAHISKGLLEDAQTFARKNVSFFRDIVSEDTPLIGIEPSAILGFRDEYPRLVDPSEREGAIALGKNCLLIDEFLSRELDRGRISSALFTDDTREILLHGHCHQKALSSVSHSAQILALPKNYSVKTIPSGCCGMAGSFGYEKEHYQVSMQIGETVLFPALRSAAPEVIVAATGTSCRQQIHDGTGKRALHPVEILFDALR